MYFSTKLKKNHLYLPYYFKVNEKYCGYKEKDTGAAYPTSTKRFG